MAESPREMRISSNVRGVVITALIALYGLVFKQPGSSLSQMFLIGATLQLVVICLRRFVPPDRLPQAMNVFELLADGATVLVFTLGVYGGMARMPTDL
jgi:multisubunit Na+/H+ antiporter MnhB subunit